MFGYMGKVIRVDLSSGDITRENLKEEVIRDFIGGIGIGVRVVYDEVPPGVDALDPENRLVFSVGPLTGTAFPGSCRYHVVSKSPNTTFTLSVADSGGFFAPKFKATGHDAMIIQGAAEKPVYIWVDDDVVEVRDAEELWGKETFETEDALVEMLGDKKVKVACIGPAGENLVRFANIENDKGHLAGRGGFGAVMGSKKLKAIAVRGTRKVLVKDQLKLIELGKELRERGKENPIYKWGTGCSVEPYYQIGALPVKNLTTNIFPEHEKLSGPYLRKTFKLKHKTCFNCFMTHNHYVEVTEGPYKGFIAEEPEYENITAFGFNWGIPDLGAVTKISDFCDRLGMDSLGLSWPVSMTAEAYEKGLLTKEDLGGIDLRWGNAEAFMELMKKIACRDGIGDVLAEGAAFGAERLGGELPSFAVHCKNMSIKCVDIRALWGRCLAFSVAHSGPTTEHLPGLASGGIDAELDFSKPLKLRSTERHAEATRKGGLKRAFIDTLGVCWFPIMGPLKPVLEALEAVTDRQLSLDEALTIAERTLNLQRCFNIRHGLTPKDDTLSERLLTAPKDGPAKGISVRKHLRGMVLEYYQLMGWNLKTGKPTRTTLRRLGLNKEEKDLWG